MKKLQTSCVWVCVLTVLTSVACYAVPPQRDHKLVPEDYFSIATMTSVAVSPDGRFVAYDELRWEPPREHRNADLWLVERETGNVQRLTFDHASDTSPVWSSDGKYIYFKSNRKRAGEDDPPYDGKSQVWRIARDGGEPLAVTRIKGGVGFFDLSGDGQSLYYTTAKDTVDDEWKDLKKQYDKLEYGDSSIKTTTVWRLDLVNWRTTKVFDEERVFTSFDVADDESRIAMVTRPDSAQISSEGWSRVDVYDAATKTTAPVTDDHWRDGHPSPHGWIDSVKISSDAQVVAWTVSFDGFPTMVYTATWAEPGGKPEVSNLPRPPIVTVAGGSIGWRGTSHDLCYVGEERARARVYCGHLSSPSAAPAFLAQTHGDVVVHTYDFDKSGGVLAVNMSRPSQARDLYIVESSESYKQLTKTNPQMDTWKLPQTSVVSWTGANGDKVEGILELPPDYKKGDGPIPMVVEIHGGPTAATLFQFRFWIYGRSLMPAQGYAVFSPNYRGSTGYGDEFMVELVGHENDIDVTDILDGVDAMVDRGIADPDRLAVMGWSNGGFLTNCVITHTDRFKAASSGAGVLDQIIEWATEDTPGHVFNYNQGLPWQEPGTYRKASPLNNLGKVTTPTLIHVGEKDERVPAANARGLYRGLFRYLHVPTQLVVYPGEGHGLSTYTHRKAKMEWDLAWFAKYLNPPTKEPETKPRSGDIN